MAAVLSRPNYDDIDYFDCSDKPNGTYPNPRDCTRFIVCSNGRADDRACPDCDPNNPAQCGGQPYLIWDDDLKRCEWPTTTTCIQDPP